jgi:hypothetical protein
LSDLLKISSGNGYSIKVEQCATNFSMNPKMLLKLTNLWHFTAACVISSKLSVGSPVRRASSLSLGLKISTKSSNSCGIGVSIPPASNITGTPAFLAACMYQRKIHVG